MIATKYHHKHSDVYQHESLPYEKLSVNVYSNDMHNGLVTGQSPEFSDTG